MKPCENCGKTEHQEEACHVCRPKEKDEKTFPVGEGPQLNLFDDHQFEQTK
jgi:recombinational DNA repair protein RecR